MSDLRNPPLMRCGHAANATSNGQPSCAICGTLEVIGKPSLEGRTSICADCRKTRPSDWSLPFFEYRGPDSHAATRHCGVCGKYDRVHQATNPATGRPGITDHAFVPKVFEHDAHYDGCRGWD